MQTTVRFGEAARSEAGDISSDRPITAAALAPKLRNDRRDVCLALCKVSPRADSGSQSSEPAGGRKGLRLIKILMRYLVSTSYPSIAGSSY
jgi:hypothetical protein